MRYRYGWIRPNATAKESERIVSVVFFSGYFSFGELISNLAGRPNNTRLCTGGLQLLSRDLHIAFKWLLAGCLQNSAVLESGHHPSAVVLQTLQTADILHSPDGRYRGPHKAAPTDWEGGRAPAAAFPQNIVSAEQNFMESWRVAGAGWVSRGQHGLITTPSLSLSLFEEKRSELMHRSASCCCRLSLLSLAVRCNLRGKMQKYLQTRLGGTTTMHAICFSATELGLDGQTRVRNIRN